MGPIILLDKSAFQRLSAAEYTYLNVHYIHNLVPVLAAEIIGDLRKVASRKRPMVASAEAEVEQLARKFGGSGPMVNVESQRLLAASLLGRPIAMTGQIVVGHGRWSADGKAYLIDLHAINEAILRWRQGRFHEWERKSAEWMRQATRDVQYAALERHLRAHGVVVQIVATLSEVRGVVDGLLADPAYQQVWLEWAIELANMDRHQASGARYQWRVTKATSIEQCAPYAAHWLRVLLTIVVAVRSNLLRWDASHARDAEYLLYLPFCQVFSSADKMHIDLAPGLLREDQVFVPADVLKSDLKAIAAFWGALSSDEKRRAHWVLSGYPPPLRDSFTWNLWYRLGGPLRPGANVANKLPDDERAKAIAEMQVMYDAAGLPWNS